MSLIKLEGLMEDGKGNSTQVCRAYASRRSLRHGNPKGSLRAEAEQATLSGLGNLAGHMGTSPSLLPRSCVTLSSSLNISGP